MKRHDDVLVPVLCVLFILVLPAVFLGAPVVFSPANIESRRAWACDPVTCVEIRGDKAVLANSNGARTVVDIGGIYLPRASAEVGAVYESRSVPMKGVVAKQLVRVSDM